MILTDGEATEPREVLFYDVPHTHVPEQDTPSNGTICVFKNLGLQSCYVTIWNETCLSGGMRIYGKFSFKEDALLYAYAKCSDLENKSRTGN